MPRRRSLLTVIRDIVQQQVHEANPGTAGHREPEEEDQERAQTVA
jgi:hypothetical protein